MGKLDIEEMFTRYKDDVYRLALSYTHSVQEAEDVCQSVFLKLMEQRSLAPGKEKAWLMQVTANQCRNLLRSAWWKRTVPLEEGFSVPEQEAPEISVEQPSPEPEKLTPEDLEGTWLMVSGVTEGYEWDAMPGSFESMVFRTEEADGVKRMAVDSESGDYSRYVPSAYYGKGITVLEEPLYEGCGNEDWSVMVGEKSPVNEDGYPIETEYYVTLLDQDTMLRQQCFTLDGAPMLTEQTFRRFPVVSAAAGVDDNKLANTVWICESYTDRQGVEYPTVPGRRNLMLELDEKLRFRMMWEDEQEQLLMTPKGGWILGEGNTLLLYGYDEQGWYAGSVGENDTPDGGGDVALYLWVQGGIMKLVPAEHEFPDENGYVDTMNELEGAAFAAPEEALLVIYSDQYQDMKRYEKGNLVPIYEAADTLDSRNILITAVLDETLIWLENGGYVTDDIGTLWAGESVMIRTELSDLQDSFLCFEVKGEVYAFELSSDNLDFYEGWSYIFPA